jgi:Mg-chelatase subunit ChlD
MEFVYEIFEGDQLFVVGYDEKPEIIQEWTDDAKKLETSLATFRKQGNPYLFDSLSASVGEILTPLMPGTRKTVVVLISDGLDRGSKIKI